MKMRASVMAASIALAMAGCYPLMGAAQAGGGAKTTQSVQPSESGQGASPQGGQGAATQVGTPPAQLKREETARRRAEEAQAASGGSSGKQ